MKLLVAIIHKSKVRAVRERLLAKEFRLTELAARGAFSGQSSTVFLLGIEEKHVEAAMTIFRECCTTTETTIGAAQENVGMENIGEFTIPNAPATVPFGGANVFVLDVEKFARF